MKMSGRCRLFGKGRDVLWLAVCLSLVVLMLSPGSSNADVPPGCSSETTRDFLTGFNASDFNLVNVNVDTLTGALTLQTGTQVINPQQIVVPFDQEVSACFLYENAGYTSTLGWMLKRDAVDTFGNFRGWANIPATAKHEIFRTVADGSGGGDGILDNVAGLTETQLAAAGYLVDGNGSVTPADMCKPLLPVGQKIAAGEELVFWLANNNGLWDQSSFNGSVLFTKTSWNPDNFTSCLGPPSAATQQRYYRFGEAQTVAQATGGCTTLTKGLFEANTITRLGSLGLSFLPPPTDVKNLAVTYNQKFDHAIAAAPQGDPNQWVLTWEDLNGGGDMDYNDILFRIRRQTGGAVQLAGSAALLPADSQAYYTAVTFAVYDEIPSGACTGKTAIKYYVSPDNGVNWIEVRNWDKIKSFTIAADGSKTPGSEVPNWVPGSPERTYREARIDFAAQNVIGRQLLWKASLISDVEACVPKIYGATLNGSTNSHAFLSRSSPVMVGNVLYSGSFETPDISWALTDGKLRGHVKATRLYDPQTPAVTSTAVLWDAGERLNVKTAADRKIYTPNISATAVAGERLGTGDGILRTFQGTLVNAPLVATTVLVSTGACMLQDEGADLLRGDCGSGTLNRFTGAYAVTFDTPPASGVPVSAAYVWYRISSSTVQPFVAANATNAMLALDDRAVSPTGYVYDFDRDGSPPSVDNAVTTGDRAWLVNWVRGCESWNGTTCTAKSWKLGPIDHSTPAVLTPPGTPEWYFGAAVTTAERDSYAAFKNSLQARPTVVFAGARDGMLHAFDAGKFRWGDNPDTTIKENRGYFLWEGSPKASNYGTGNELWAFITANLVPRLKNNRLETDDQSYVDASPSLADVRFDRTDLSTSACTARGGTSSGSTCHGAWSTVLLMAEGNGGDSVSCLDVTDVDVNASPAKLPQLLWEFADPDLFRSRSSPAVGQIGRVQVNGTAKWAAFFVSGKTYNNSLYPSIYVLDVVDGSLIDRIFLDSDPAGIGGVPSGQPSIVDSDGNGYIDRIYIGTDKGRVYKVNLSDDPGAFWGDRSVVVINGDFSDEDGGANSLVSVNQRWHPVYASPAVVVDNTYDAAGAVSYKIRIFFGTGDSPYFDENIDTGNTTYHFFAYVDEAPKLAADRALASNPGQVKLDWFYTLPAGQRVFASAFASAGKVYFGTSTSETEDPCAGPNTGQTYVFDQTGTGAMQPTAIINTGDVSSAPLVADKHLFVRTQSGMVMMGGGNFNNETRMGGFGQSQPRAWREIE